MGAEINKNRKKEKQYKEQRAGSLRKINKIDKPLSKLIKRQRENIQINKVRIEKGDITTETREIQRIIRSHYKNWNSTTLENGNEMDCLLDRYHIPKLNQDQVSKIRPKNYKDIEAAIKTLPTKKKQRTGWL